MEGQGQMAENCSTPSSWETTTDQYLRIEALDDINNDDLLHGATADVDHLLSVNLNLDLDPYVNILSSCLGSPDLHPNNQSNTATQSGHDVKPIDDETLVRLHELHIANAQSSNELIPLPHATAYSPDLSPLDTSDFASSYLPATIPQHENDGGNQEWMMMGNPAEIDPYYGTPNQQHGQPLNTYTPPTSPGSCYSNDSGVSCSSPNSPNSASGETSNLNEGSFSSWEAMMHTPRSRGPWTQPNSTDMGYDSSSNPMSHSGRAWEERCTSFANSYYSTPPAQQPAPRRTRRTKTPKLNEFLLQCLESEKYNPAYIKWVDRQRGTFIFVQSKKIAELWGHQKNKKSMTFEYMSRAIRYYYKSGLMSREEGRRLVYKFGPQ